MWTRLIAGAAAHDINNLVQSLFNLLALASKPSVPPESLQRYGTLAREGLRELQRLSADLRALAASAEDPLPQRFDLVCADVLAETDPPPGRSIPAAPSAPGAVVRGTRAALRVAIQAPLHHALAASPPGDVVELHARLEPTCVILEVVAPLATTSVAGPPRAIEQALADREFRNNLGLALSGAIAREYGGGLEVGPGSVGGLSFKLQFARVEEAPEDVRRAEQAAPGDGGR
jgi:signal transduction histidine kinase